MCLIGCTIVLRFQLQTEQSYFYHIIFYGVYFDFVSKNIESKVKKMKNKERAS